MPNEKRKVNFEDNVKDLIQEYMNILNVIFLYTIINKRWNYKMKNIFKTYKI